MLLMHFFFTYVSINVIYVFFRLCCLENDTYLNKSVHSWDFNELYNITTYLKLISYDRRIIKKYIRIKNDIRNTLEFVCEFL